MKVSRIVKLVLTAVCFLLVSSTVVAKEEVSWTLDDYDYSLTRQWNVGEFYNRTSVDVTYDVQTSMGYLQIDGGHLDGDELHDFSVGLYRKENVQGGNEEQIWHKKFYTLQASIPFSSRTVHTSIKIRSTPARIQNNSASAALAITPARV